MTKEQLKQRRATPKGKAITKWNAICDRAENRRGDLPTYQNVKLLITREEFMSWAIPQLEKWQKEHGSLSDATLDRITDGNYQLGNLQLITKGENTLKRKRNKNLSAPLGKAWCGDCKDYLPVDCFNKRKTSFNGLMSRCKKCYTVYDKLHKARIYINDRKEQGKSSGIREPATSET